MIKITLKLPRTNENGIKYTGDADKYLNLPITINDKVIGVVTKILNDSDGYIEVEGMLYKAGANLVNIEDSYFPSEIEIRILYIYKICSCFI